MGKSISEKNLNIIEGEVEILDMAKGIIKNGQEYSFYLCNLSDVVQKYKNWTKALPRIKSFYAVKCNSDFLLLKTLAALGSGFDCASMNEISKILSLGVDSDRIIFAHTTKRVKDLHYTNDVGVSKTTFDSEEELYKIKANYSNADLLIRLRFDNPTAFYNLGNKFGVNPGCEAEKLLILAKNLNLNVVGVAFHIGSSATNYSIFIKAIESSRKTFDFAKQLGFDMKLLDIGGGFPGNEMNFAFEFAEIINPALDEHFPDKSVQIIAEPGRYYAASAFTLITKIIGVREVEEKRMYYVDSNIFNGLTTVVFGEKFEPIPLNRNVNSNEHSSVIWGSTCHSSDKVCDNVDLPLMNINEWIVFKDAGAYTISNSCKFNGIPLPDIFYVIQSEDNL